MEIIVSDSRSSNFVFVQDDSAFVKSYEESSDDKDSNEEAQIGFTETYAESDDVSLAADYIGKDEESIEHDPLVESINDLHFCQEEFEREVQKWSDVGKDDSLISNDSINEIIKLKDTKITELELAMNSGDIRAEVDDCLMKIIQADVEHVVITETSKRLTEGLLREIKDYLLQKNASLQDLQATKKQDWKMDTKENLKKLQNRVCRFSSILMIQLILLLVTLYQFYPQEVEIVPT